MPSPVYRVPGPLTIKCGGVSIGVTQQGALVRIQQSWTPVLDDIHGEHPADYIYSGASASVEVIGMDVAELAGHAQLWDSLGGAGAGSISAITKVGGLAYCDALYRSLEIDEYGGEKWLANATVLVDPAEHVLKSTQEVRVPLIFLVVPDANDKLFVTVPDYMVGVL